MNCAGQMQGPVWLASLRSIVASMVSALDLVDRSTVPYPVLTLDQPRPGPSTMPQRNGDLALAASKALKAYRPLARRSTRATADGERQWCSASQRSEQ